MPEDVLRKIKREDEKSSCVLKQADDEHKNVYRIDYNTIDDDKIHSIVIEAFNCVSAEISFYEAKDVENAKSNFINKNENVKIIDVENILNENDEFQDVVNDMMIGINGLNE